MKERVKIWFNRRRKSCHWPRTSGKSTEEYACARDASEPKYGSLELIFVAWSVPPLFIMQQMHTENGPSLSLGLELHWVLQLQVLFKHAVPHDLDDNNHSNIGLYLGVRSSEYWISSRFDVLLYHHIICLGCYFIHNHDRFFQFSHVLGGHLVYDYWVLREEIWRIKEKVSVWYRQIQKLSNDLRQ